ncbi:hypothetical protein Vadar_026943 [Vaccinium darrowii]|uniref:Uncharacterized protein n=1 Tax=Vaccinium darrowii TaxID=229202 RepID=A0ACB7Y2E9_9ERIC|nr:hypothetical protein Vadar_026943 [Vaccinium darrowii]
MDLPAWFRTGFGAARGLPWLYHGCQPPILPQNLSSGLARFMTRIIERSRVFGHNGCFIKRVCLQLYGFEVVLLELAFSQKPLDVSNAYLVDWVVQLSSSGQLNDAIDKSLCVRGHDEAIAQFLGIE